ncbi:MAG: UDP-N-acetylmuramate dehydrogenase [Lachnospiraceae bacterium]|nr:UDP-N-acetylmuramate dehydrogenase [Lachnospiraceae bacterium]
MQALGALLGQENVMTDEPLARHTSFRIGGPADLFLTPEDEEALAGSLECLKAAGIPCFIMGNGTNLLVSDEGFRGAVIQIGKSMGRIEAGENGLIAGAGALLSRIAAAALSQSLSGFEFAGGIPGSLGGACIMNAGAYGGEMKDVLERVRVLTKEGEVKELSRGEFSLGYRSSSFMKNEEIVLGADIRLHEGSRELIAAGMEELRKRRAEKQPIELPSAGSTFKRPKGYFAGKLIMDSGLRGARVGGAMVSEKHCGFVVNVKDASAEDVLQLIMKVQKRVWETFGVQLEPEVRFLGEFHSFLPEGGKPCVL